MIARIGICWYMYIIKAARFAPSGFNKHAIEFVVVKDAETKQKIFEITEGKQELVKDAPVILVLACDTAKTQLAVQDLSVASENVFLQAAAFGLATVWKNLTPEWEAEIKNILGMPENFRAINIIPIGWPKEQLEPHSDGEMHDVIIHKEKW